MVAMSLAGQKLRAWRKARRPRMTLEDFGRRYRVTGPAVHFWETGTRIPSAATIKRLAADGVCEPGDWYKEARSEAESPSDKAATE